jgi:hypothetical protein
MEKRISVSNLILTLAVILGALTMLMVSSEVSATLKQNKLLQTDLYVANFKEDCISYGESICFFNDPSIDETDGAGTGLRQAILHAKENNLENVKINIIGNYRVKSNTVLVDYPVTINGMEGAKIHTTNTNCNNAMLSITDEVTIQNLLIDDGICTEISRDLILVDSSKAVTIRNNTLRDGKNAIIFYDNTGNLTLLFNNIENNSGFAAIRSQDSNPGVLKITANRIVNNNNNGVQVSCGTEVKGNANHNYWGEGILPSNASLACVVNDAKGLGAEPNQMPTGIAGERIILGTTYSEPVLDGFSAKASTAEGALIVVNHGPNRPFESSIPSAYEFTTCGNFYDIFMDQGAIPETVSIRFSYDGSDCAEVIESTYYCGSDKASKYPLMWHDPEWSQTYGYDNVGTRRDEGSVYEGQPVECNINAKTIAAHISRPISNRPSLDFDMDYTPFTIGFDQLALKNFEVTDVSSSSITLNWTSYSEANMKHFRLLRSETLEGPYTLLEASFPREGDAQTGASYSHTDMELLANTTYYYKLQAFSDETSLQDEFGPVSEKTSDDTPTETPTTTPTETLTQEITNTLTSTPTLTTTPGDPSITPSTKTNTPTSTSTTRPTNIRTSVPTKTRTPGRPTSTPYPIRRSPTPTRFSYRPTSTNTRQSQVRTSTPVPELTRNVQNQTLTAFFMTQTMRYSTKSSTETPETGLATQTASPGSEPQATESSEREEPVVTEEAGTITPTATLKPVMTDKSDRYEEKASPRWPLWLSIFLFAVIGVIIYTRRNTL